MNQNLKIEAIHLDRQAIIYVRQSLAQMVNNKFLCAQFNNDKINFTNKEMAINGTKDKTIPSNLGTNTSAQQRATNDEIIIFIIPAYKKGAKKCIKI